MELLGRTQKLAEVKYEIEPLTANQNSVIAPAWEFLQREVTLTLGFQGSRAGQELSQGWSVPPTDPLPKVLRCRPTDSEEGYTGLGDWEESWVPRIHSLERNQNQAVWGLYVYGVPRGGKKMPIV